LIDSLQTNIADEIPRHKERWTKSISYGEWNDLVEIMREFARERPNYVSQHFKEKFNLSGMASLTINNDNPLAGKVIIHKYEVLQNNFQMTLFKDIPITLEAVSMPGYRFVGWQGVINNTLSLISFNLEENSEIYAIFEKDTLKVGSIVINEINYNSSPSFDTDDWIELYNFADSTIDLSNWVLKDEDDLHNFTIPENTLLEKDNYLVLCKDTLLFGSFFPNIKNIVGNFDFGLNGSGELIRLFDNNLNIIDSLTYDDNPPWQTSPDGNGATLELLHPKLDNSLAQNWAASVNFGSPGKINSVYTKVPQNDDLIPTEMKLEQNFPNPFNPSTVIKYSIPQNTEYSPRRMLRTTLKVYDILGNEVAALVNENQKTGNYEVKFGASNLASGVYVYQLQSGGVFISKKMLLIK
jgi:hypothetical protein